MGINVLHIAVHLGGGVGTVIKNWIKKDEVNSHTVLLLNKNYYGEDPSYIHPQMRGKDKEIKEFIQKADVVIIHFWNHPYLFDFLVNFKFPECRVCVWSHVSGLNPPYVHLEKMAQLSDKFVLSSPISFNSDVRYFNKELLKRVSLVWTTGGVEDYLEINRITNNKDFVIGYIGTLDYSKIHPNFVQLCEEILKRIPEAKFVICGTGPDEGKIKEEVNKRGVNESFTFMGMCHNIKEIIPNFSVFGYPLNNKHFGTCEQVLGEVMAAGVMPIVLDNPAERLIVSNVGKISKDSEEYIENIVQLYSKPINKETASILKGRAKELYSIDTMMDSWNELFIEVIKLDKKEREWKKDKEAYSSYEIFLESIGKYADIIEAGDKEDIKDLFKSNNQWLSKNKGSVYQYQGALPDKRLLKLCNLLDLNK